MMSHDHENFTTDGFKAWTVVHLHYTERSATPALLEDTWSRLDQKARDAWHAVAQSITEPLTKRLGGQITSLSEALRVQTEGYETVELDYTNDKGVRGTRHVKPLSVLYGVTDWHTEPGLLMPCWDLDRGAFRIYSLEPGHLHAWNGTPVERRGDRARLEELEAENLTLRTELAAMGARYASAVDGRAQFRSAFREAREAFRRAEAKVDPDFAEVVPDFAEVDPAKESLAARTFTTEEICRTMAVPPAMVRLEPAKAPTADSLPRSEMLARMAGAQWHLSLGFTGWDWNGLTENQKDAWRTVVAYLVPPPRMPYANEQVGIARLNQIREEMDFPSHAYLDDADIEFLFAGAAIALANQLEGGAMAEWRKALTTAADILELHITSLTPIRAEDPILRDAVKAMRGVPAAAAESETVVKPERSREEWRDRVTALNRDLVLLLHRGHTRATFKTAAGEWNGVVGGFTDLPCGDTEFRVLIGTGLAQKVQLLRVKDLREVGFA